jgi:hypothetical protein
VSRRVQITWHATWAVRRERTMRHCFVFRSICDLCSVQGLQAFHEKHTGSVALGVQATASVV